MATAERVMRSKAEKSFLEDQNRQNLKLRRLVDYVPETQAYAIDQKKV